MSIIASMKKPFIAVLSSFIVLLCFSAESRAGRPKVETENGAPGSGIKKISHVYFETNAKPPAPAWREMARGILYNDGRQEDWGFRDDGRTVAYKRYTDKSGFIEKFDEFNKDGTLVRQILNEKSGKSRVFVNVDGLGKNPADIDLKVGDELYLVKTFEPWPGSRSDAVTAKANAAVGSIVAPKPPSLPNGAHLIEGFIASKAGDNTLTVTSTLTFAGGASRHGFPPRRSVVSYTINVKVK